MRRRQLVVALLALLVGSAVLAQAGSTARGREGGILRVSFSPDAGLDYIDPALSFTQPGWLLLEATCARLYTYPDTPSPASYRPQPEVAASYPSVSKDLKTYTFRLRSAFRFSNGKPVRASAFEHAINRALQPSVDSPGEVFVRDIVGAEDVLAGRAESARGVVARGNTLVVRFTRAAPDFLARTTLPFFCAVPPGLPSPAEGVGKYASAGPYYVTEFRKKVRIEIRRNPFYGGKRKVHLDGFDVNLNAGNRFELLRSIDRGGADWGSMPAGIFFTVPGLDFVKKYGLNGRFRMKPGLMLRMLAVNSARPLFRDNPRLRRAVNFALDRRAILVNGIGGLAAARLTDQHLPHSVPGFRDEDIYPFEGNLERARQLADGHRRGRVAVLVGSRQSIVAARLIKEQLGKIGLDVEIDPTGDDAGPAYMERLTTPGAEWDLAYVLWTPTIPDAYAYLKLLVQGRGLGGESLTRVRPELAGAALDGAVLLPSGRARDRTYAEVDATIARDVAPVAVLNVIHEATLVSKRVDPDCMVLRPALDLAVACLRK